MTNTEKIYNAVTEAEIAHALTKNAAFAVLIANNYLDIEKLQEAQKKLKEASDLIADSYSLIYEGMAEYAGGEKK